MTGAPDARSHKGHEGAAAGVARAPPNPASMEATEELPAVPAPGGPPPVLGRYRLGARLGSGGFGTVYAAVDERLDRDVAVKVIPAGRARARARRARPWPRRGSTTRGSSPSSTPARTPRPATSSPSSCAGARSTGWPHEGELSDRDVLRVGLALADALEHAHGRGVIHRDVKPQNVIVPDRPRSARSAAKLTDFGVAHLAGDAPLTRTGDVVGTLAYMAPEQADGQRVDERADLYSLALVLYEGLAGVNPVRGGSPAATARKLGTVLPPLGRKRKDLPAELCAALDRALSPRPEDRGTLDELADELAAALTDVSDEGGTILAHPLERPRTAQLPPVAGRIAGALAAAGLAAAAADARPGARRDPARRGRLRPPSPSPRCRGSAGWLRVPRSRCCSRPSGPGGARRGPAAARSWPRSCAARATPGRCRRPRRCWAWRRWRAPTRPAGRAGRWWQRAGLGAAGLWWLLLAEPLLGETLLAGADAPRGWRGDAGAALDGVLWPPLASGLVALAAVWALAALLLPWLVRGRYAGMDFVAASAWAAGLGSGTAALAEWAGAREPRGLVAGAVAAGALAWLLPRLLPRDIVNDPR